MNRRIHLIHIISLALLLGTAISKSDEWQQYFDKEFLTPLVGLVEKISKTELATLDKQKLYLEEKLIEGFPQYAALYDELAQLEKQIESLDNDIRYYRDSRYCLDFSQRYCPNLYKIYQQDKALEKRIKLQDKRNEIWQLVVPYEQSKWLKNRIEERVLILKNRNPIVAVFETLNKNFDFSQTNRRGVQVDLYNQASWLKYAQSVYDYLNLALQEATASEKVREIGNISRDTDKTLQELLIKLAASMAWQISKEENSWNRFVNYMQEAQNKPEDVKKRLEKEDSKPFHSYSIVEPSLSLSNLSPSFKPILPVWMSNLWKTGKDYWAGLRQRAWERQIRPGFEHSLQRFYPEDTGLGREYEIERALQAGQDFTVPIPRSRDYRLYKRYMQPTLQRWAEPSLEAGQALKRIESAGGY